MQFVQLDPAGLFNINPSLLCRCGCGVLALQLTNRQYNTAVAVKGNSAFVAELSFTIITTATIFHVAL
jgi:uncharacterized protein YunC (DUF1805 family)